MKNKQKGFTQVLCICFNPYLLLLEKDSALSPLMLFIVLTRSVCRESTVEIITNKIKYTETNRQQDKAEPKLALQNDLIPSCIKKSSRCHFYPFIVTFNEALARSRHWVGCYHSNDNVLERVHQCERGTASYEYFN